jgi:hypothetical protein
MKKLKMFFVRNPTVQPCFIIKTTNNNVHQQDRNP